MDKRLFFLFAALIAIAGLAACDGGEAAPAPTPTTAPTPAPEPTPTAPPTPKTTEVKPKPGVPGVIVSGDYPAFTIDDCIEHSDAIVIGEVADIPPAKRSKSTAGPLEEIIYQDVIIKTERYLHGEPETDLIAVRVLGGEIGDEYMANPDMTKFTIAERSLLCLNRHPRIPPEETPEGIDPHSYYQVTGGVTGKFDFSVGVLADYRNQVTDVATFEERIAVIKGG